MQAPVRVILVYQSNNNDGKVQQKNKRKKRNPQQHEERIWTLIPSYCKSVKDFRSYLIESYCSSWKQDDCYLELGNAKIADEVDIKILRDGDIVQ